MTQDQLLEIAFQDSKHCLSIYLPTHQKGHQVHEGKDKIQFKNHLQKAKQNLEKKGLSEQESKDFLKPCRELLEDGDFWFHREQGLAVFVGEDYFKTVSLPYEVENFNELSQRMHIKQLVPYVKGNDKFYYILSLSQNKPRIFATSKNNISLLVAPDMPEDISKVTKYYDVERETQSRPSASTVSHGTAPVDNREEDFVLEFFRQIDESLRAVINQGGYYPPLVLVGMEHYHAIYEKANTYPNLLAHHFTKNFEDSSKEEIYEAVHSTIFPKLQNEKKQKIEIYKAEKKEGASDIAEVLKAAYEGRIDALFVGSGHYHGSFDKQSYKVNTEEGDLCLYNEAVCYTLKNGGEVFVEDEKTVLDSDKEITALLRH